MHDTTVVLCIMPLTVVVSEEDYLEDTAQSSIPQPTLLADSGLRTQTFSGAPSYLDMNAVSFQGVSNNGNNSICPLPTSHPFAFTPEGTFGSMASTSRANGQELQADYAEGNHVTLPALPSGSTHGIEAKLQDVTSTRNAQECAPISGTSRQRRQPRNKGHLVRDVDYEVIQAAAEDIECAILVTDGNTSSRVRCGHRLLNTKETITEHMRGHGGDLPSCIAACPFGQDGHRCGGRSRGGALFTLNTFVRHVLSAHFTEKEQYKCLRCDRTYTRKDSLSVQRNHPCVVVEEQVVSENGSAISRELVEEEDEGPVAGPSRLANDVHPQRPAKRQRIS